MPRNKCAYLPLAGLSMAAVAFVAGGSWAQDLSLKAVQEFLDSHGYQAGPADGFMGPITRHAIRSFQTDHGLPVTGVFDDLTSNAIATIRSNESTNAANAGATKIATPSEPTSAAPAEPTNPVDTGDLAGSTGVRSQVDTKLAEPSASVDISQTPIPTGVTQRQPEAASASGGAEHTPARSVDHSGLWWLAAMLAATWVLLRRLDRTKKTKNKSETEKSAPSGGRMDHADDAPSLRQEQFGPAAPPHTSATDWDRNPGRERPSSSARDGVKVEQPTPDGDQIASAVELTQQQREPTEHTRAPIEQVVPMQAADVPLRNRDPERQRPPDRIPEEEKAERKSFGSDRIARSDELPLRRLEPFERTEASNTEAAPSQTEAVPSGDRGPGREQPPALAPEGKKAKQPVPGGDQIVRSAELSPLPAASAEHMSAPNGQASPPHTATAPAKGRGLAREQRSAWVPKEESAVVAGRPIGGLVYVGPAPRSGRYPDRCRAYIDPSLPVALEGANPQAREMPYWPNYSEITPRARATYLSWLAGGRRDATYDSGYMFLYFYGLERRFFMDDPSIEEKRDILAEVGYLRELYPENSSAQNHLSKFIECAKVIVADPNLLKPVFEHSGYELPLSLKAMLGAMIAREEPLSADWVLSWWTCCNKTSSRTPLTRCPQEFRALFMERFIRKFPNGLPVKRPMTLLVASYDAASSEFQYMIRPEIDGVRPRDISGLRTPIKIAEEIAESAMNDLDKYSRYLGKHPERRGTIDAYALLPAEVRHLFPSESFNRLAEWIREIAQAGGKLPLADLIERIAGARPDKISERQQIETADTLAILGFGMAPDARYALRAPRFDEPVVLFELPNGEHSLEEVSDAYRSALVIAALGAFVAQADGQIAEAERDALVRAAESMDGLSVAERARLQANIDWLLAVPPDLGPLREKLKGATAEQSASFRRIVVAIAHADSVVSPQEVRGIEKIYRALGLDPQLVYADIHAGRVGDGPITVRQRVEGSGGDPVPAVEAPSPRPILDAARIAAIQADTAHVSSVLGEIFADEPTGETVVEEPTEIFEGLDAKHAALVRILIEREHWSEEEFSDLARTYGLMTAGCLETINEWSFHHFDDALIEEYDGYDVSFAVAERVRGSG